MQNLSTEFTEGFLSLLMSVKGLADVIGEGREGHFNMKNLLTNFVKDLSFFS